MIGLLWIFGAYLILLALCPKGKLVGRLMNTAQAIIGGWLLPKIL